MLFQPEEFLHVISAAKEKRWITVQMSNFSKWECVLEFFRVLQKRGQEIFKQCFNHLNLFNVLQKEWFIQQIGLGYIKNLVQTMGFSDLAIKKQQL